MSQNKHFRSFQPRALRLGVLLASALCATGQALAQTATETTLYTFSAAAGYAGGQLIQGADGNYYGVTAAAGSNGGVFRLSPSGVYTQLYTFTGGSDGALPTALLQGPDGNLYGVASTGNCANFCAGTIFELTPSGTFTLLHSFIQAQPSSLTLGADGNLYGTGTTADGAGVIFELALPSGVYSMIASSGFGPQTLVQGSDGNFYGMTQAFSLATNGNGVPLPASDGTDLGTVFGVTPSGKLTTLYSFTGGKDGANYAPGTGASTARPSPEIVISQPAPITTSCTTSAICPVVVSLSNNYNVPKALVEAADGTFYGTAEPASGIYSNTELIEGSLFNINVSTSPAAFVPLYTFSNSTAPGSDGGGSYFGLTFGGDGNLYGVSGNVVFNFTPVSGSSSAAPNPLYTFTGGADGSLPQFLLPTSSGTFAGTTYGTTSTNTACTSCGTVFSLAPSAPVPAPVQVSILPRSAGLFAPLLTWVVPNAYSLTAQQCYAFQYGGAGGGTWTGKQTGTLMGNLYTGSANITPTVAGTYTYALTCGGTVSGSATLTVPPLAITTTSLAAGYTAAPYTATLAAGGSAPYFWKVVGGALPAGLTLGTGTGVISGTPTGSGTYYFTVQVAAPDVTSVTASVNLSINVVAAAITLTPPALTVTRGSSQSTTIALSGFATNNISLSCGYLPAYATCSFGPLVGTSLSGTQTLSIATPLFVALDRPGQPAPANHKVPETSLAALLGLALLLGLRRRRGHPALLCLPLLLVAAVTLTSCDGVVQQHVVPAGTYTVNINATAGTQNVTVPLQLTVQ
jgi:MYXO-CTERM domain-containing protein